MVERKIKPGNLIDSTNRSTTNMVNYLPTKKKEGNCNSKTWRRRESAWNNSCKMGLRGYKSRNLISLRLINRITLYIRLSLPILKSSSLRQGNDWTIFIAFDDTIGNTYQTTMQQKVPRKAQTYLMIESCKQNPVLFKSFMSTCSIIESPQV